MIQKGIKYPERIPGFVLRPVIKQAPYLYKKYVVLKNRHIGGFESVPDPFKLITINPNNVSKLTKRRFGYEHYEYSGTILSGDWDKNSRPLKAMLKVRSLVARFRRNTTWEKTELFAELINSEKNRDEVLNHLRRYDRLYEHMQQRYKTSFELPNASFMEEICVSIGREGEIYCSHSGIHRLTIAQILNISEVPVRVMVRHKQWQLTREACARQLSEIGSLTGDLESFKHHPDMQDICVDQVTDAPG